jgi:hypothetical protein
VTNLTLFRSVLSGFPLNELCAVPVGNAMSCLNRWTPQSQSGPPLVVRGHFPSRNIGADSSGWCSSLVDVVRGKAFRVASVMMDSKASLLLHAVVPLADALDRPGPAILPWVFLEAGLAGPPPYSMSIGGHLVEGQRLNSSS